MMGLQPRLARRPETRIQHVGKCSARYISIGRVIGGPILKKISDDNRSGNTPLIYQISDHLIPEISDSVSEIVKNIFCCGA